MLIAVTSTDGKNIDQHFGKAERFLLYEAGSGEPWLVCEVQAPAYCGWTAQLQSAATPEQFDAVVGEMRQCADAPPSHGMMPEKLAAIARELGSCRIIVTAMIGDAPREEMERLGFDVYTMSGPVGPSLKELANVL
jgi:predicted Fe-Mo cluster-binding NifX family protein